MDQFRKKSLLELRRITVEELIKYHAELRKYEFENGVPLRGIQIRKITSRLSVLLVKIDRLLAKEKITIVGDKRVNPAYLLLGDPGETYRTIEGLLLFGNGSINLETRDKVDRRLAYLRCIELLNKGGNLLIFPEGAWNIYEHNPVAEIFDGAAKMGIQTGADIIPGAIEQYGKEFKINIGENIPTIYRSNVKDLSSQLRDELATLRYEIFESVPKYDNRPTTNQAIWEGVSVLEQERIFKQREDDYGQSIVDRCDLDYDLQDVYETRYNSNRKTADQLIAEIQLAVQQKEQEAQQEKRLKLVAYLLQGFCLPCC